MRILHIIPTLGSGGAEKMLSKLVTKEKKHTHIIVTLLNVKPHYNLKNTKVINLNFSNNTLAKIRIIKQLFKIIKWENIDIIQTWSKCNYYGPILKYRYPNKKIISNFRNGYSPHKTYLKTIFLNKFWNKFDGHIFVSNSALRERLNSNLKFSNKIIIPNGFESPPCTDKNKNKHTLKIGHIGRYHPIKNQKNIIKAFHHFSQGKKVELLLAGKNLTLEHLNIDEARNSKIKYWGEILQTESFYKEIDVLILASKSEGFPNVIGEAMSHGVYVISTNAGESFEILGDTGYKLKNGEISEIIKSFKYIYSNEKVILNMKNNIRNRIRENYSIDSIIEKYQKYYETIGGKS